MKSIASNRDIIDETEKHSLDAGSCVIGISYWFCACFDSFKVYWRHHQFDRCLTVLVKAWIQLSPNVLPIALRLALSFTHDWILQERVVMCICWHQTLIESCLFTHVKTSNSLSFRKACTSFVHQTWNFDVVDWSLQEWRRSSSLHANWEWCYGFALKWWVAEIDISDNLLPQLLIGSLDSFDFITFR